MNKKDLLTYGLIILVVILIRAFVATPIRVNGDSMNDTLINGEIMLLTKFNKNKLNRFDIVVLDVDGEKYIKRVIGLPKEDIEYRDDILYINGKEMKDNFGYGETKDFKDYCAKDEYFVLGDNRGNSKDSRALGCISKDKIEGKTNFVFFPFSKFGKVK